jgi:LCP family protein required for cell wall assembly
MSALRRALAVTSAVIVVGSGIGWWATRTVLGDIAVSDAAGTNAHPSADGPITILLIGLDSRKDQSGNDLPAAELEHLHAGDSDSGGYNTNTLILAQVTPDDHLVAFSIPRDDYVADTDIPGYDHMKIKEAYGLAKAAEAQRLVDSGDVDTADLERKGRDAGRTATLNAVRQLTGVTPDYFAEVNLDGFYELARTVGGVDVCLNAAVHDDYSGADFPAGPQHLDAEQSLAFVRQRHGLTNGDLDRTHRQQAFLTSVLDQLDHAGTFTDVTKLDQLLDVAHRDVVLSQGWTPALLARLGAVAHAHDAEFHTLPVERYDSVDGHDVNVVDPDAIKAQIAAAFHPAAGDATPSRATVDVINATSREGLAGKVSDVLSGRGFQKGDVRSALPKDSTLTAIVAGPGADADARAVGDLIGLDSISSDDRIPAGHVVVTLGESFDTDHLDNPTTAVVSDASAAVSQANAPTNTSCVD